MALLQGVALYLRVKAQLDKGVPLSRPHGATSLSDWHALEHAVARDAQPLPSRLWPALLAFVLGVLSMLGLLSYAGNAPINLLLLLCFFGPLQWLMMLLAVLGLSRKRPPWLLTKVFSQTPLRYLPYSLLSSLAFYFSQFLSWIFLSGALLCFVFTLLFQDLAFAWGSTLQLDGQSIYQLLHALSLPWRSWWPQAAVSLELVNASQFYRLREYAQTLNPQLLASWWPYLLAFALCYAWLPRLILMLIAQCVLARQLAVLCQRDHAIATLLAKWRLEHVQTGSEQRDPHRAWVNKHIGLEERALEAGQTLGCWGLSESEIHAQGLNTSNFQVKNLSTTWHPQVLVVPGWEPPLGELSDLLQSGEKLELALLPLQGKLNEGDVQSWLAFAEHEPKVTMIYRIKVDHG